MRTPMHYYRIFFWFVPVIAWKFSGKSFPRTIVLSLKLWWFVLTRKTVCKGKILDFSFTYREKSFLLQLEQPMDIASLAEVFVLNEYEWELKNDVHTILDLGAHWGDTTLYYALTYPNAKILAVEPTKHVFERLDRLANQFPNVIPIQASLGEKDGKQTIYVSENSLGNSIKMRQSGSREEVVQSYTISSMAKLYDIGRFDLIKFDIEGAEEVIFKDENIKKYGSAFIGEVHLDLISIGTPEVMKYFSRFEVETIKLNNNRFIIKAVSQKL